MPRKTLALICGLVLITFILFVIALRSSNKESNTTSNQTATTNQTMVSAVPAHSVLSMSPNPLPVKPGQTGSVMVNLDASDNDVTAVQLEIAYDPNFLANVKVTRGMLFANAVPLIDKNTINQGRYTYAFGIAPNQPVVKGMGNVAVITFTALKPGQSQLALLPTSLVTARGISESVLKSATGTLVQIGQ